MLHHFTIVIIFSKLMNITGRIIILYFIHLKSMFKKKKNGKYISLTTTTTTTFVCCIK